ncbi:phospholipid phosphatase-related protein type 1-like [Homalodisca vitripennis]|uniref:phospholipid phosphatase-related protein type 1-like n=1 Tax=Homalodisca vitripennis TaxID=197043 RepID=UPI001EEC3537|nr:phospholipid phosphatase-related protein type 1-like [Homalodisca vitripennis]KAG8292951.1 Phospholipid phosphatase- protein type 5 [Homalodisca vitripennis]
MSTSSWSSTEDFEEAQYISRRNNNTLRWIALGLEILGGVLVTAVAVYLRLAHFQPPAEDLNWKLLCNDMSLYEKQTTNDNSIMLYVIILAVPSVFIFFGEVEFALLSKKSYFENMDKMERMGRNLPRMIRIYAMFFIGIMLASFSSDYIKIMIASPRPYFLTIYGSNCPLAFNGTKTDDFYEALKSFPSHLSCVAGFTCVFAIGYAHKVRAQSSTPLLTPIMTQGFLVLAVTTSLDRYTSHFNHTSDILAGLLLGLVLALYTSNLLLFVLKLRSKSNDYSRWLNFLDFMIPRVSMPPTYSAEAMNARTTNPQINSQQ